jgi:predicted nucleotidyltransferase component of viral defense system
LKKDTLFFRQAELLLRVLPFVNEEEIFALKGGTAINFFLRDLPRLSVDIDLTYLPVNDRETALNDIDKAFLRISEKVEKKYLHHHPVDCWLKYTYFMRIGQLKLSTGGRNS